MVVDPQLRSVSLTLAKILMPDTRLLALVQKPPGIAPNQRFRHEQWAPYLAREHGIQLEFAPFESPELTAIIYEPGHRSRKAHLALRDTLSRWRLRHRAREFAGVVVLREASFLGGSLLERTLAANGSPVFYDFDDAIWRWEGGVNGILSMARLPWKVGGICSVAAAVTVGNEYLASYARRYSTNVHIIRTSIDLETAPSVTNLDEDGPFTIVWTGSHSTVAHLETVRPALEALGKRLAVRLRVVCDVEPRPFANVAMEFVRWRATTEAADLIPSHVGIMPLPDTPFTRGKCGCKALQYMAVGRPAVVSPVGINREIVRHGENGLLAESHADWVNQLERLARDRVLLLRLARAARRTVAEEGFSASASAREFARVVHQTLAARRSQAQSPAGPTESLPPSLPQGPRVRSASPTASIGSAR